MPDWLLDYALEAFAAMGAGASIGAALYAVWRVGAWFLSHGAAE